MVVLIYLLDCYTGNAHFVSSCNPINVHSILLHSILCYSLVVTVVHVVYGESAQHVFISNGGNTSSGAEERESRALVR